MVHLNHTICETQKEVIVLVRNSLLHHLILFRLTHTLNRADSPFLFRIGLVKAIVFAVDSLHLWDLALIHLLRLSIQVFRIDLLAGQRCFGVCNLGPTLLTQEDIDYIVPCDIFRHACDSYLHFLIAESHIATLFVVIVSSLHWQQVFDLLERLDEIYAFHVLQFVLGLKRLQLVKQYLEISYPVHSIHHVVVFRILPIHTFCLVLSWKACFWWHKGTLYGVTDRFVYWRFDAATFR